MSWMTSPMTSPFSFFTAYRCSRVVLLITVLLALIAFFNAFTSPHTYFLLGNTTFDTHSSNEKFTHRFYRQPNKAFFPPSPTRCLLSEYDEIALHPALCANFPTHLLSDVQIIVKTGAAERGRTKTMLATFASCISNILIFSDVEDEIEGHRVMDILSYLPQSYSIDNPDWKTYEMQRQAASEGTFIEKTRGAWRLDRLKWLPMVEKAFDSNPTAKWYVFIEPDIYYFWDTLFRLLDHFDPNEHHYFGSPTPGRNATFFAYGGGGMVLSHGLMRDLLSNGERRLSTKYEDFVRRDCCGDATLGYIIFKELGTKLEALYPIFSGETLTKLPVTREKLCIPLLGVHRISSRQMEALWRWERCRPYDEYPITYSSILDYTLSPILRNGSIKESWDNFSDRDLAQNNSGHLSASMCGQACKEDQSCLQFAYSPSKCRWGHFVKSGEAMAGPGNSISSGWDLLKLKKLGFPTDGNGSGRCKATTWVRPVIF